MKKLISLIVAVFLCFAITVPVFAVENGLAPRLIDDADLLLPNEETELLNKLDSISEEHEFDVIVITVRSLGNSGMKPEEFSTDIYMNNDFGFADKKDGIIFLVSMQEHDWNILAKGYGETVFTDSGLEYIADIVQPLLNDGEYNLSFNSFADECDSFLTQAENGTPFDEDNLPRKKLSLLWIPGSVLLGMVISLIIMLGFRSQLKSVRSKSSANDYEVQGSLCVTHSSEIFLYQNVTRVPKQTQNTSRSGPKMSSSGRSIGGKF